MSRALLPGMWTVLADDTWRSLQDRHGPVLALVALALAAPLALLGYRRPRLGGALLLVVGIVPMVTRLLAPMGGGAALGVLALPLVIGGLLYLSSGSVGADR